MRSVLPVVSPSVSAGHSRTTAAVAVVAAMVLGACSTDDGRTMKPPRGDQGESIALATTTLAPSPSAMTVTGPWSSGSAIDARYTCAGLNTSPPLSWTAGPTETKSYAVVLTDLDAPDYIHWIVANIDPTTMAVGEGVVPNAAIAATNSADAIGYAGPCPPEGSTHTYDITVYALGQMIEAQNGDDVETMLAAIESAQIATASTSFTFTR